MSPLEKETRSLSHHVWLAESEGNFRQKKMTTLATRNLFSQIFENIYIQKRLFLKPQI